MKESRERNGINNEHLFSTHDNVSSELYCRQEGLVCGTNYVLSVTELLKCHVLRHHAAATRYEENQLISTEAAELRRFNISETRGATGHELYSVSPSCHDHKFRFKLSPTSISVFENLFLILKEKNSVRFPYTCYMSSPS